MSTQDERIVARMKLHQHFTNDGVAHGTPKGRASEQAYDMIYGWTHAKVVKALEIAELKAEGQPRKKKDLYIKIDQTTRMLMATDNSKLEGDIILTLIELEEDDALEPVEINRVSMVLSRTKTEKLARELLAHAI